MTSIFKAGYGEINEFLGRLSRAGFSAENLRRVNAHAPLAERMVRTFKKNPFALPAEGLIDRLRQANQAQGWDISKDAFARLRETAPLLPEGAFAFLSLRVRFDEGQKGVQRTAEAHIAEICRVIGESNVRQWEFFRTSKKHLRLLVGNETHKPAVEWCVIDLDTHWSRTSVTAVRGPRSIADEGLVHAWLYPEYTRAIVSSENPGYFLAGYELNARENDGRPWYSVPIVCRYVATDLVILRAYWRSNNSSDCGVASLRE